MNACRILFVDDDPRILNGIRRSLGDDYLIDVALGAPAALSKVREEGPFGVVVADMRMPGMSGLELLQQLQEEFPDTIRIMLTGNADQETTVNAVNEGRVFRFINKPCDDSLLRSTLDAAIKQYELIISRQELLEKTLAGSVRMMTDVLAMVDPQMFGKAQLLRELAHQLCTKAGYPEAWHLELGALLSNIGQISVPPSLTAKVKAGKPLSYQEEEILRLIPTVGHNLLSRIPYLEKVALSILHQNRRYESEDLPTGQGIPFGARILKVLKDLQELETESGSRDSAIRTMSLRRGWYDPMIMQDVLTHLAIKHEQEFWMEPTETTIRCLRAGQIMAADLYTNEGVMLVAANSPVTPALLERLQGFAKAGVVREPLMVYAKAYVAGNAA